MAAGPSALLKKISNRDTETLRLLSRVHEKLSEEIPGENTNEDYLQKASRLTGISAESLAILENRAMRTMHTNVPLIDRSVIYTTYTEFCLTERRFPTSEDLYLRLQRLSSDNDKIPQYMDIMSFRKLLVEMAFVWKKVGKGFVVMENPEDTFERHYYLSKLLKFEEENVPIYYVDENYIFRNDKSALSHENADDRPGAVKPLLGIICALSRKGVHALDFPEVMTDETFEEFIQDNLLPTINDGSVIIFDNSPHHCVVVNEPPTLMSLKTDMMNWLDVHNVPYEVDMSKYELYELAQRFTSTHKSKYKMDNIVEARGHRVLRIPRTIEKLTPATSLRSLVMSNLPEIFIEEPDPKKREQNLKSNIRSSMTFAKRLLFQYTRGVHDEARRIYNVDFQIDDTWDILVKNTIESGIDYVDSDFLDSSDEE